MTATTEESDLVAVTEAVIVPVKVLNPGDREYLTPNLVGLQNMAMSNLPVTINFVNIIEAFREVVNGVRYELLVNAVNTTEKSEDKDLICRLVVLEQPWLVTIWGDKVRLLKYSNCSDTETDQASQDSINQIYKTNTIFDGSAIGEDEDGLVRIEAQIIQPKEKVVAFKETTSTTTTSTTLAPIVVADENVDDVETTTEELSDDSKKWLDGFFGIFESPPKQSGVTAEVRSGDNVAKQRVSEESEAPGQHVIVEESAAPGQYVITEESASPEQHVITEESAAPEQNVVAEGSVTPEASTTNNEINNDQVV